MSATDGVAGGCQPRRHLVGCLVACLLLAASMVTQAQGLGGGPVESAQTQVQVQTRSPAGEWNGPPTGVWLVTYGPGEIYWQRFGHNAIWIRDSDLGLDHVFNFGFFDFEQEDFFLRFLQGRMLYFSAAQPAQSEFAQYIDENRSIRLQKLALTEEQALRLADYLVNEVRPQNRDYLYDYYLNNCSTRIRDALDVALDGQLQARFSPVPGSQTFREHTRRLTVQDFWLYLGLELVLGRPVDRELSRWDEFFIPAELADAVSELGTEGILLEEDVILFQSSLPDPDATAPVRWPAYGMLGLLVLGVFTVLVRRYWPQRIPSMARAWLALTALVGSALVFFWSGTDHAVAAGNFNLLLFNPLALLLILKRLTRPVAWLVLVTGLLALLQGLLPAPPGQYTADVVAAFLPMNLAAAWALLRADRTA